MNENFEKLKTFLPFNFPVAQVVEGFHIIVTVHEDDKTKEHIFHIGRMSAKNISNQPSFILLADRTELENISFISVTVENENISSKREYRYQKLINDNQKFVCIGFRDMPEAEFVNIIPVAAYDISEEKVIPKRTD